MSESTLQYPAEIAEEIGLNVKKINAMKHHGCRFIGRKTSVAWVREHLLRLSGGAAASPSLLPLVRHPRLDANKSCELASAND